MKKIITTILTAAGMMAGSVAVAQNGYGYNQLDAGFGVTLNKPTTGIGNPGFKDNSALLNFTFNQTPFINHVVEAQYGRLSGSDHITAQSFRNDYKSVSYRAQLQLGEVVDYSQNAVLNSIKNLYVGAGFGMVFNDLNHSFNGRDAIQTRGKTSEMFVPMRVGYEFKFYNAWNVPTMKFDVGYQYNLVMGNDLDGYSTAYRNDRYSQLTMTFKIGLGMQSFYRKSIAYAE